MPKVYSAANLDGAIFTSAIPLSNGLNTLFTICFKLLSLEAALQDLTQSFFAPPNFAANKSKTPIGVSHNFKTYL